MEKKEEEESRFENVWTAGPRSGEVHPTRWCSVILFSHENTETAIVQLKSQLNVHYVRSSQMYITSGLAQEPPKCIPGSHHLPSLLCSYQVWWAFHLLENFRNCIYQKVIEGLQGNQGFEIIDQKQQFHLWDESTETGDSGGGEIIAQYKTHFSSSLMRIPITLRDAPSLKCVVPKWALPVREGGCKGLPGWLGALFSMSKCVISCFRGVRTLASMVCALFSSFWQCQTTDEKIGSKKCSRRPVRQVGGLKLFGQCP